LIQRLSETDSFRFQTAFSNQIFLNLDIKQTV
jgi:hypothetical protein